MANERNTKFRVVNRKEFLKTVNPSHPTLEGRIGLACADSADQLLKKIRAKRLNEGYKSSFSISSDNINRYVERVETEMAEFTITVLNTFLCFFFFKKSPKYQYAETHTEQNLKDFFKHITIRNGKEQDLKKFNKFMSDLELIKEHLTPLFNDFCFEINAEWELSMVKNSVPNKDIKIDGTTTINQQFYDDINKKYSFTKTEFYTAKAIDNCQWWGIIQGYAINREKYNDIKNLLSSCFDQSKTYKVSAVVHGDGGCGKSTLLRKLAIKLRNEDFVVLWVQPGQFNNFVVHGLEQIREKSDIKFLVFIEDWYRLVGDESKAEAENFIKNTDYIRNIRLIIGDRDISGKAYTGRSLLKTRFLFTHKENKTIINKILDIHHDWKGVAKIIFKKEKSYSSTLFLLLFILARIHEENLKNSDLNLTDDPEIIFKDIIRSDAKFIAQSDPGLAKMLFYWSCIYKENTNRFISKDCFLQLAAHFNGHKKVSKDSKTFAKGGSKVDDKLRIYINIDKVREKGERLSHIDFLQFNHDILAEKGIAEIGDTLQFDYDKNVKRGICDKIITIKKNDYSVSLLLGIMMQDKKNGIFTGNKDALYYVKKLLKKDNQENHYLDSLQFIGLSKKDLDKIIEKLEQKRRYPIGLWGHYIKKYPEKASNILTHADLLRLPKEIVSTALKISKREQDVQTACTTILTHIDPVRLPFQIVSTALNISKSEQDVQRACTTILTHPDLIRLPFQIVSTALNISKSENDVQTACTTILTHPDLLRLPDSIVSTALKISKREQDVQTACITILTHPELLRLPKEIVSNALKISKREQDVQTACTTILTHPDLIRLPDSIVSTALKISKSEQDVQTACTTILTHPELLRLPKEIVSNALNISKSEQDVQTACTTILTHPDLLRIPKEIVSTALKISRSEQDVQTACTTILTHPDLIRLPYQIVSTALNISKSEQDVQRACTTILTHPDLIRLPHSIVSTALKISKSEQDVQTACTTILTHPDLLRLPDSIVSTALKVSTNDAEIQTACITILTQEDIVKIPHQIVSTALNALTDDNLKFEKASFFLQNWKTKRIQWTIIYQSLRYFSTKDSPPSFVISIVEKIINNYLDKNHKEKKKTLYYLNLLKLPFRSVHSWKTKSKWIIDNWDRKSRNYINNVLYSYQSHPDEIKMTCLSIINNWREEISEPIKLPYGKTHYGDHLKIALGHPNLKNLAKEKAQEIRDAYLSKSMTIPEYFIPIVDDILDNDNYPEWKINQQENTNAED